jgi:hypothetical protein
MRLHPPKSRKKELKTEQEILDFMLAHKVIGGREPISVKRFFINVVLKEYPSPWIASEKFLSMWPIEYQEIVRRIFYNIACDIFKKKKACKAALH